jgi:hypothetical protein
MFDLNAPSLRGVIKHFNMKLKKIKRIYILKKTYLCFFLCFFFLDLTFFSLSDSPLSFDEAAEDEDDDEEDEERDTFLFS